VCVVICTIATLLAASVPAWAADPAVEEYSLRFPNAKGKSDAGAGNPRGKPSDLAPGVRRDLAESPNGKALAAVATAPELGAPELPKLAAPEIPSGDDDIPSPLTAALGALDDLPVLLGLLALIGGAAWAFLRARRIES
jgi:hypothetical protein